LDTEPTLEPFLGRNSDKKEDLTLLPFYELSRFNICIVVFSSTNYTISDYLLSVEGRLCRHKSGCFCSQRDAFQILSRTHWCCF